MPTYSRTHEDCERRIDALKAENSRLREALGSVRWRAEEAIRDCPVKHRGTVPYTALGHILARIDAALAHQPKEDADGT